MPAETSESAKRGTWMGGQSKALHWGLRTFVVVAASLLLFTHLGATGLKGDEGIYALVTASLVEGEHGLHLMWEGRHYLNKPPLAFFFMAGSTQMLGLSELSLRLPGALASLALALLVFQIGGRRASLIPATAATILFLSAPRALVLHGWRAAVTEPWLALWTLLTIVAYGRFRKDGGPRLYVALSLLGILNALTKGPLGPALIAATLLLTEILIGRRSRLHEPGIVSKSRPIALASAALFPGLLAYVSWWLWNYPSLAQLRKFVGRDWWLRATGELHPVHVKGPLFFLERLVFDFGPWLMLLLPALLPMIWRRLRREEDAEGVAFRLFPVISLLIFTASSSKLVWYMYPSYPILVLVAAEGLEVIKSWVPSRRWATAVFSLAILFLVAWRGLGAYRALPRSGPATLHRLETHARVARDPLVLADKRLYEADHKPREWNRFAMTYRLQARTWDSDLSLPQAPCLYVLIPDPERAPLPAPFPPESIVSIERQPGPDPGMAVVDLCGGAFAEGARR